MKNRMKMKRNSLVCMITVAMLMLNVSSCKAQKETGHVAGSGVETLSLPAFDAIENESAVVLHFKQGSPQSVRIRQADNWRLKASVSGRTLRLDTEDAYRNVNQKKAIDVWVTAPSLKSLGNNGSLRVDMDALKSGGLTIKNDGAMNMHAGKLDVGTLVCENNGSLKYGMSVKADRIELKNDGALKDTVAAECPDVSVVNHGSLKTELTVSAGNIFNMDNYGALNCDIKATCKTVSVKNNGQMQGDMTLRATTMKYSNDGAGAQRIDFTGDDMNIVNNGSAKIDLRVDCKTLRAESAGVSKLNISGTADDTRFNSGGISKIDSSKLNKF